MNTTPDLSGTCDETPLDFGTMPFPGWKVAQRYGTPKPPLSERVRIALRNRRYRKAHR